MELYEISVSLVTVAPFKYQVSSTKYQIALGCPQDSNSN